MLLCIHWGVVLFYCYVVARVLGIIFYLLPCGHKVFQSGLKNVAMQLLKCYEWI